MVAFARERERRGSLHPLILLVMLTGCASSPDVRLARLEALAQAEDEPQVDVPEGATSPGQDVSEPIVSMGLPRTWQPYAGGKVVLDDYDDGPDGGLQGFGGVYRSFGNPLVGALGVAGEAYASVVSSELDGGVRLMLASPVIYLQGGIDYSIDEGEGDFILSLNVPLRRGGLFHRGDTFRVDWIPERESIQFGISIPLGNRWMGRTRPWHDEVSLPRLPALEEEAFVARPELDAALDAVAHASAWMSVYTTPFFDHEAKNSEEELAELRAAIAEAREHWHTKDALYPDGHRPQDEVRVYHEQLEKAFALAAPDGGPEVVEEVREILLDEVILPYDRLLGQRKKRDSLQGFGVLAERRFEEWLGGRELPARSVDGAKYAFRRLLAALEDDRARLRERWGDNRYVWMPVRLALEPEDHDTQEELDALLERAVGRRFRDGNEIHYVINELFQVELAESIRDAEDYHVLWIHDFRGVDEDRQPDSIGFRQAVHVYMPALVESVKRFDETGKLTSYFIFLDQIFFEVNDGRLWMELLADPLHHEVDLPDGYEEWQTELDAVQEELRAAVAASSRLQAGRERFGEDWLRDRVKVHVNITNPSDFSFRSSNLIPHLPFVPDNLLRDHRKIVFWDVTELDPGRGGAMLTGMGIGEHYAGRTWDDRALVIRGPDCLEFKRACREMLLMQSFGEDEIPPSLRELPIPADYEEKVAALCRKNGTASLLQAHNVPGFGDKRCNVVKAVLYECMPGESVLVVPDSLWNSPLWAGMLLGASLRGAIVGVISPALENAPSDAFPQMSRANEVMTRLLIVRNAVADEIESQGGLLGVGVYALDLDLGDVAAQARLFTERTTGSRISEVFPFAPEVYEVIRKLPDDLDEMGYEPSYLTEDREPRKPKLHLKNQLFWSRGAFTKLMSRKEWAPSVRDYFLARAEETAHHDTSARRRYHEEDEHRTADIVEDWASGLTEEELSRVVVYLLTGSMNEDYRGMVMDGEVLVAVSGGEASVALLDFMFLVGLTDWLDQPEEVEKYLPAATGWRRWFGRYIKNAL